MLAFFTLISGYIQKRNTFISIQVDIYTIHTRCLLSYIHLFLTVWKVAGDINRQRILVVLCFSTQAKCPCPSGMCLSDNIQHCSGKWLELGLSEVKSNATNLLKHNTRVLIVLWLCSSTQSSVLPLLHIVIGPFMKASLYHTDRGWTNPMPSACLSVSGTRRLHGASKETKENKSYTFSTG